MIDYYKYNDFLDCNIKDIVLAPLRDKGISDIKVCDLNEDNFWMIEIAFKNNSLKKFLINPFEVMGDEPYRDMIESNLKLYLNYAFHDGYIEDCAQYRVEKILNANKLKQKNIT